MTTRNFTTKTLGLLAAATALVSLASCNKNENFNPEETKVAMTFVADINGTGTKATETAFEENDEIGIIPMTYAGNVEKDQANIKYTYNNAGKFTANPPYYFHNRNMISFYAYYPYKADLVIGDDNYPAIELNTKDQVETDYLQAAAMTTVANPSISYTGDKAFKHVMSKLTINLRSGDGVGELTDDNTSVSVGNFIHTGYFHINAGNALLSTSTPAPFSFTGKDHSHLLIPQEIEDGKIAITVTYGGVDYNATLNVTTLDVDSEGEEIEGRHFLLAGTHYTYTITVKNTGLVIESAEIKGWDNKEGASDATL